MKTKVKFKVLYLAYLSGRNVVAIEQLNNIEFKVEAGMYLGKVEILGFELPRIIDINKKLKSNTFVFWVDDSPDLNHLKVGDIVELTEQKND